MKKRHALYLLFFLPLVLSVLLDLWLSPTAPTDFAVKWWHTVGTRALCALAALALLLARGGSPLRPLAPLPAPRATRLSLILLAFAVALNNLPIFPLLSGAARLTAPAGSILLFALGCLAIGLFEEFFFRGVLLVRLLDRLPPTPRGRLAAVLISSAVFGLIHLFNLAAGAGALPTLLQVGYSFLIGCLMALLLLACGNLLLPVLCHALYDITGRLVPECGAGTLWDTPTTLLTLALSLATLTVCLLFFWQNAQIEHSSFGQSTEKPREY